MEINLVAEGVKFMIIGMGTVFLFLMIMIVVLKFQAHIIGKYFPEKIVPVPPNSSPMNDKGLVAAISAAIQMYKKRNQE